MNGVDHYGSHLSKDEEQGQGGGEDDEGVGEDVQDERGGPAQLWVGRPLRNTCNLWEFKSSAKDVSSTLLHIADDQDKEPMTNTKIISMGNQLYLTNIRSEIIFSVWANF